MIDVGHALKRRAEDRVGELLHVWEVIKKKTRLDCFESGIRHIRQAGGSTSALPVVSVPCEELCHYAC